MLIIKAHWKESALKMHRDKERKSISKRAARLRGMKHMPPHQALHLRRRSECSIDKARRFVLFGFELSRVDP